VIDPGVTNGDVPVENRRVYSEASTQETSELTPEPRPELVIGLVGPVGTELHQLARSIEERLSAFRYRSAYIRVSQLIQSWCEPELATVITASKGGDRIRHLMNAGDGLRRKAGKGDALVPLIVSAIRAARSGLQKDGNGNARMQANDVCYIIDSLKHPAEVKTLRGLYGDRFVLISAFDSEEARSTNLKNAIAKAHVSTETEGFKEQADDLIKIDAKRPGERFGQNVRETFPLGDFFVRVAEGYEAPLNRFLDVYFGSPYLTPLRSEYLMFEASAIALRSADLSRQIGAVVIDRHGEIVSSGCNEVPTAGGGAYWPDDLKGLDNRDYRSGKDFNAVKKFDIVREFMDFLEEHGVMRLAGKDTVEDAVKEVLTGKLRDRFKDLRVSNLIEFGRVVHAEMSALMRAAQRGIAVGGGEIYSTTFPCHMCARHIISAGIVRVVYIEPYPKSMTADLFPEIVSIDAAPGPALLGGECSPAGAKRNKVVSFEPFEGIAPPMFLSLFQASERKDRQGYIIDWNRAEALPKIVGPAEADLRLEQSVALEVDVLPRLRQQDV